MNDRKIPIYGNGKNIRDWIFVNDHCDAIYDVLLKGKAGQSYNISANNELDNMEIIKLILKYLGKSTDLIEFVEDRPGHDFRYSLDSSKIRKEIGWKNSTNFEEGLYTTIEWFKSNYSDSASIEKVISKFTPWKADNNISHK